MTEILCVTHKYPPSIGGMEKQSYELIKGLSKYYKTHVIAYQNDSNKTFWFASLRSKIQKELSKHPGIKLIHLNDGSMAAACLWLQKNTYIPVVVTYHGLDITFPLDFYQSKIVSKLNKYQGAVCVSEFTRNECIKRGFDENTTFTVRNGVDISMGDIPKDSEFVDKLKNHYGINITNKNIILAIGRPVKRKGFSWFIKNVMPLLDKNTLLIMTGPIKNEPSFFEKSIQHLPGSHNIELLLGIANDTEDLNKELGKHNNIFHLGSVPFSDLIQLLSLADIFVMPNIVVEGDEEGFGLVALEASIRGTYVLASGIEGITDAVIDGKNGTLLPSGDAAAWADKIKELLSDKNKLQELAEKGKKYTLENYSWNNMISGYHEVFEMIINPLTNSHHSR